MKHVLGWGVILILCTQNLSGVALILVFMVCMALDAIPEEKEPAPAVRPAPQPRPVPAGPSPAELEMRRRQDTFGARLGQIESYYRGKFGWR